MMKVARAAQFSTALTLAHASTTQYYNLTITAEGTRGLYVDDQGVCFGIVSEMYVRGSTWSLNSTERLLRSFVDQLPAWLSSDCHFAARKYLCASALLYPKLVSLGDVFLDNGLDAWAVGTAWASALTEGSPNASMLLSYSFYAPSYPDITVCTEYAHKCSGYLSRLAKDEITTTLSYPSSSSSSGTLNTTTFKNWMLPRCSRSAEVEYGSDNISVAIFSANTNQTVLRLPTSGLSRLSPALTTLFSGKDYLAVKTATNYLYSSDTPEDLSGFQTTCPSRFVVPDDKSHPRNHWIAGSGCAQPCRLQLMTLQDYHRLDSALRVSATISVPVILAVLIYWLTNKSLRENFMQMAMYMACVLPFSISLQLLYFLGSSDEVYCVNNAVRRAQEDGPSICTANAAMFHFFTGAVSFTWMLQAIEVYIKFSGKLKRLHQKRVLKFWDSKRGICLRLVVTFLLPLILLVEVLLKNEMLGYNGDLSWCLYREEIYMVEALFRLGVPNVMCFIIGGYFLLPALSRIGSTIWNIVVNRRRIRAASSRKERRSANSSSNARSPVPRLTSLQAKSTNPGDIRNPANPANPAVQPLANIGGISLSYGRPPAASIAAGVRGNGPIKGRHHHHHHRHHHDNEKEEKRSSDDCAYNKTTHKRSKDISRGNSSMVLTAAGVDGAGAAPAGTGVGLPLNRELQHQQRQKRKGRSNEPHGGSAKNTSASPAVEITSTANGALLSKASNQSLMLPSAVGKKPHLSSGSGSGGQQQSGSGESGDESGGGGGRGGAKTETEEDESGDDQSSGNELTWKKFAPLLRANASVLIFLLVHATVWSLLGIILVVLSILEDRFLKKYAEWTECVFNNYQNENPDAWMDACGEHPPDFGFKNPLLACYVAAGLYGALVCMMHFSSLIIALTRSMRLHVTTLSGFFVTCGECMYDCIMMEDRHAGAGRSGPMSVVPVPQSAAYDNRFLSESGY